MEDRRRACLGRGASGLSNSRGRPSSSAYSADIASAHWWDEPATENLTLYPVTAPLLGMTAQDMATITRSQSHLIKGKFLAWCMFENSTAFYRWVSGMT